jgi:hypothetical protein
MIAPSPSEIVIRPSAKSRPWCCHLLQRERGRRWRRGHLIANQSGPKTGDPGPPRPLGGGWSPGLGSRVVGGIPGVTDLIPENGVRSKLKGRTRWHPLALILVCRKAARPCQQYEPLRI